VRVRKGREGEREREIREERRTGKEKNVIKYNYITILRYSVIFSIIKKSHKTHPK
tara:strand:+ start:469 stop:633 length:165 start_codon:yes stop_codon:yes gene_type:complete